MTISAIDAGAAGVVFDPDRLLVTLRDGRELGVPIDWLPRLRDATSEQRADWRLIGSGEGIHWPSLDEDISVAGLLRTS